jgi:hypothetical protein
MTTNDVLDMLRADRSREEAEREQMRVDWPGCTAIVDEVRAEFGPGVKAKYFSENGKTMGKPLEFIGTDVDQYLRMVDADAKRRGK